MELTIRVAHEVAHTQLIDGRTGAELATGLAPFDRFRILPVVASTRFVGASDAEMASASDELTSVLGPAVAKALAELPGRSGSAGRVLVDLVADPELASLPWELVAHEGRPISADPRVMWRRVSPLDPFEPGEAGTPIVTILAAGPSGEQGDQAEVPVVADLVSAWSPTAGRLSQTLALPELASIDSITALIDATAADEPIDVLVLVAHGRPGELLLAGGNGRAEWVPAERLAQALAGRVRLVLLASCRSAELGASSPASAVAFVRAGIPVIAMHREVFVTAASTLSTELVRALRQGRTLHEATLRARIEVNELDVHLRSYAMASLWQGPESVVLRPTSPAATGVPPAPPDPRFDRFEGRAEVIAEIAAFAADPDRRVLAVLGTPGSGKSRLMRRLHDEPSVPRVVASALRDPDPGTESASTPGSVITRIGEALAFEAGGLDRLEDWRRQSRDSAGSSDEDRWRDLVASQPAGPEPGIVIIDALDESPDPERLRAFLGYALPTLPAGLSAVLSARDPSDLPRLASGPALTVIDLRHFPEPEAITAYAAWVLSDGGDLADSGPRSTLARAIGERADGVFLYARAVCAEILAGTLVPDTNPDLLDTAGFRLPAGMGDLYSLLPDRIGASGWPTARSVIAAVCVCRDPAGFSTVHLADLLDLPETIVRDVVHSPILAPFLRETDGHLRPFHASLTDWIEALDDGVVAGDAHRQIAAGLLDLADVAQAQPLDRYALRHLLDHLIETARAPSLRAASWARSELAELVASIEFLEHTVRAGRAAETTRCLERAEEVGAAVETRRRTEMQLLAHGLHAGLDGPEEALQALQWAATAVLDTQLADVTAVELRRRGSPLPRAAWISDPYQDHLIARITTSRAFRSDFEWNRTGTHLAGDRGVGGIHCFDLRHRRFDFLPGKLAQKAWSPDGRRLAVAHGEVNMFDSTASWAQTNRSVTIFDIADGSVRTWPVGDWVDLDHWAGASELLLRRRDHALASVAFGEGAPRITPITELEPDAWGHVRYSWDPVRREIFWVAGDTIRVHRMGDGTTRSYALPRQLRDRWEMRLWINWSGVAGRHLLHTDGHVLLVGVDGEELEIAYEREFAPSELRRTKWESQPRIGMWTSEFRTGHAFDLREEVVVLDARDGSARSVALDGIGSDRPAFALSPSGRLAALAEDGRLAMIDLESGQVRRLVDTGDGVPRCLRWNAQGDQLAAAHGSMLLVLEATDPDLDRAALMPGLSSLRWDASGRFLCIEAREEVQIIDVSRLPLRSAIDNAPQRVGEPIVMGAWADRIPLLAYVTDGAVGVIDQSGVVAIEHRHDLGVGPAFDTDLRWVDQNGDDPTLLLRTGGALHEVQPARSMARTLLPAPSERSASALDSSGSLLATLFDDHLLVVDVASRTEVGSVPIPRSADGSMFLRQISWSPQGRALAVAREHSVHILRVETDRSVATEHLIEDSVGGALRWDPMGQRLAYGMRDGVFVWTRDAAPAQLCSYHFSALGNVMRWSRSGRHLAFGSLAHLVVLDTVTKYMWRPLRDLGTLRDLQNHPTEETFVAVTDSGDWILRPEDRSATRLPITSGTRWARWSHDGRHLALGGARTYIASIPGRESEPG